MPWGARMDGLIRRRHRGASDDRSHDRSPGNRCTRGYVGTSWTAVTPGRGPSGNRLVRGIAEDEVTAASGRGGRAPAGQRAGVEQLLGGGAMIPDGDRRPFAEDPGRVVDEVDLVAIWEDDDVVGVLVLGDDLDDQPRQALGGPAADDVTGWGVQRRARWPRDSSTARPARSISVPILVKGDTPGRARPARSAAPGVTAGSCRRRRPCRRPPARNHGTWSRTPRRPRRGRCRRPSGSRPSSGRCRP